MADAGFDYERPPEVVDPGADGSRRWGVLDLETAQAVGFHPTADLQAQIDASNAYAEALADGLAEQGPGRKQAYDDALAACGEAALGQLGGPSTVAHSALVGQLSGWANQADIEAEASDGFQASLSVWSTCMQAAGYDDLIDPLMAIDRHYDGEVAGSEEIAAAVADVTCKNEADLWGEWQRAMAAAWAGATGGNEEVLSSYSDVAEQWIRDSQAILDAER